MDYVDMTYESHPPNIWLRSLYATELCCRGFSYQSGNHTSGETSRQIMPRLAGLAAAGFSRARSLHTFRKGSSPLPWIRCFSAVSFSPKEEYDRRVQAGEIKSDPSQVIAISLLEDLHANLKEYSPLPTIPVQSKAKGPGMTIESAAAGYAKEIGSDRDSNSSFWGWISSSIKGNSNDNEKKKRGSNEAEARKKSNRKTPRGVYMHGGVGCGKTMVMDLFYDCISEGKQRVHFHEFMLECHSTMHRLRSRGVAEDPIPHLAKQIMNSGHLICFDEFQVTDVADALLLRRLFEYLFDFGAIVVATSNRPPDDLYYNGIQRHLFLLFINSCTTIPFEEANPSHFYYLRRKLETPRVQ